MSAVLRREISLLEQRIKDLEVENDVLKTTLRYITLSDSYLFDVRNMRTAFQLSVDNNVPISYINTLSYGNRLDFVAFPLMNNRSFRLYMKTKNNLSLDYRRYAKYDKINDLLYSEKELNFVI